jgi:non-specific serine/threonine protein kinase
MPIGDSADLSVSQTKTIQKPAISAGKTIAGKYKIIEEIGRGGMGVVYKAKDTRLKRTVALKFLPPELTQDKEARQRFIQEAQAAGALDHPNICTVYEVDEANEQAFIAMSYIDGHSLKDRLQDGPLDVEEVKDIALQVAEGLKEAHERGIVHRDIKPANIMITEKGQTKITDFGLAKLSSGADLTKASTIMGTVAYMSPEQAKGESVDHRTDIWSLGVMLFEIMTGHPPFQGDHETAVVYSILNEEPVDVKTLCSDCPDILADIITTCLQKKAEMRFVSLQELLDVLEGKTQHTKVTVLIPKHNLPEQLTSFIGRRQEIETVKNLLIENRLVTLTGAGGCGKTRLASEAAAALVDEFEDGVWFINLAPVTDPNFVANEIADVLEIKEEPNKAIVDTLTENIKSKSLLILLDNCEHLVAACAEITEKLLHCVKNLQILSTSREALNIHGELAWRVPSLSFPNNIANLDIAKAQHFEAIKLFTERASLSKPGFSLNPKNILPIVQICQYLAGIPLAIELAATRIRHLGPEALLDRLEDQFKLLISSSRTAPERQQTLKATIDWSYDLLSKEEQLLFNRLSVFIGDFSLEAVENVCEDDRLNKDDILTVLSQLVDKSLVNTESQDDESVRYQLLMPLHQYSVQKLTESGEDAAYRDRHLTFYLNMAEQAHHDQFRSQLKWMNTLDQEHDNLILALNWAFDHSTEKFILLAGYLGWFWYLHAHYSLGRDYLEKALARDTDKSEAYARAQAELGRIHWWSWTDHSKAIGLMKESLDIWRQLKNPREQAIVLSMIGRHASLTSAHEARLKYNEESLRLARKVGDSGLVNSCLADLCQSYICLQEFDQAKPFVEELVVASEKLEQPWEIVLSHHFLGDCALGNQKFKEAEKEYGNAAVTAMKYKNTAYAAIDLQGVAFAVAGQSRWAKSIRLDAAARKIYDELGIDIDEAAEFWTIFVTTYIDGAKGQVGAELTKKYAGEGRNLELKDAVKYALDFTRD